MDAHGGRVKVIVRDYPPLQRVKEGNLAVNIKETYSRRRVP
jgi:hypothetical protein